MQQKFIPSASQKAAKNQLDFENHKKEQLTYWEKFEIKFYFISRTSGQIAVKLAHY